jgi:hypothetical protein
LTTPPPQPAPDGPRPPRSTWKQILITLVCGVLLGLGSCFGFASTMSFNENKPASAVFAMGFVVGVGLVLSAGVRALVAIIAAFIRGVRSEQ